MKLPTVRKPEDTPENPPIEAPLDLSVTHGIEEKMQAFALQGRSYGLDTPGRTGLYSVIWMWIAAILVFAARALGDVGREGLYDFLRGFEVVAVLPGLFVLIALTVAVLLWPRLAPRRRRKRDLAFLTHQGQLSPTRMDFRFDGEGITTTEESGEARLLGWQENLVALEDDTWFSFYVPKQELNIVIPKRDLSAEEQERVRRWSEIRGSASAPVEPTVQPDLAGAEIVRSGEFTMDKDDHVATMLEVASAPPWRWHHFKGHVLIAVGIALVLPVLHLLAWILDPDRLPVSIAWPLFLEMFATRFWIPALIGLAFLTVVVFLQPAIRRFGARYYADQAIAARQAARTAVLGENGIWDSDRCFLPWHAISRYRISEDHLLITNRMGSVLTYPKRIFPADKIAEIEALFRERAGKPRANGDLT